MSVHTETVRFRQSDFDLFAELSGDRNPIHVDPAFAAGTRFGRPVAHGMMLFATAAAALARLRRMPTVITGQDLRFPAPTFAGEDLELRVELDEPGSRAGLVLSAAGRGPTLEGSSALRDGPEVDRSMGGDTAGALGALRPGAEATVTRRFRPEDTARLADLVGDPNPIHRGPGPTLPPALLGGLVSYLLGMELPGPGTNWLRQRYRFLRPVPADAEVTAGVRVSRLRPEKHLVDLVSVGTAGGVEVFEGRSLVLVRDAAAAH